MLLKRCDCTKKEELIKEIKKEVSGAMEEHERKMEKRLESNREADGRDAQKELHE